MQTIFRNLIILWENSLQNWCLWHGLIDMANADAVLWPRQVKVHIDTPFGSINMNFDLARGFYHIN